MPTIPAAYAIANTAQAVADALNGFAFGVEFTACRSYGESNKELKDIPVNKLLVDVIPTVKIESELNTRGSVLYTIPINIGLRKKFEVIERDINGLIKAEEIDRLVYLVEQINEFFLDSDTRRLTYTKATWNETVIVYPFNPVRLRDNGSFEALVRVTYDVSKELDE